MQKLRFVPVSRRICNYLVYGDATSAYPHAIQWLSQNPKELRRPSILLQHLSTAGVRLETGRFLKSILAYCAKRQQAATALALLKQSLSLERFFAARKLRGCSFVFANVGRFRTHLGERINLGFALLLDDRLYYPPGVREALDGILVEEGLRWHAKNCIGWALGFQQRKEHGLEWYIVNIQSDLARCSPSILREYFANWDKILLVLVVEEALRHGVRWIHVVPSERLRQAYLMRSARCPVTWKRYYDRNAARLGFKLARQDRVNVGVTLADDLLPVWARRFFSATCGDVQQALGNDFLIPLLSLSTPSQRSRR